MSLDQRKSDSFYALMIGAWLAVVMLGMSAVWSYAGTPGAAALAPRSWPQQTSIPRSSQSPSLLMFAHPKCTCTRASLTELAWLIARYGDRVSTHVVFIQPSGVDRQWSENDIVKRAQRMHGVHVLIDRDSVETKRFGSLTSGQVLLYDRRGRLVFNGGITQARGHEGESAGRARIAGLLQASSRVGEALPSNHGSPVFGCELGGPES